MIRPADNPFRSERTTGLAFLFDDGQSLGWPRRLAAPGTKGLITGPHGSGKSTLLRAIEGELEARGERVLKVRLDSAHPLRYQIPREIRSGQPESAFVLFDGLEQLGEIAWLRVARACGKAIGFIATSHNETRLRVLYRSRTSKELLDRILEGLVRPVPPVLRAEARVSFERRQGNLRLVLRDLYDFVAEQP